LTTRRPAHAALWPLRFISIEAISGVVLLAAAALALIWANSPWSGAYEALWRVTPGFFLVVGLEIRREMRQGALADLKVATLPIVAAAGGVMVPALLYLLANGDPATRRGWAIPTATDIAFAVGVLSWRGA
jgi:Na+:H+ antiporter, NhaA family